MVLSNKEALSISLPCNHLYFKKNLTETFQRLNELYNRQGLNKIYAQMNIPSQSLLNYRKSFPPGEINSPHTEDSIDFWFKYFNERLDIEDDSMPCCYLSEFDQGLYAGLVGGEIKYITFSYDGLISSMVKPFIDDIHSVSNLKINTDHWLFKEYVNKLKIFAEKAKGNFGISHFILIDSLNFLFELRGATQSYLDVIENPELVQVVIDFALKLNLLIQNTFFQEIGLFNGGTFSTHVQLIQGRVISESVDPFHLTSVDFFEKWGIEPVEKIFSFYDGGIIHLHSNGRHLLKKVSQIKGIKAVRLVDEPGNPPTISILSSLHPKRNSIPLVISVPYQTFISLLKKHQLYGNIFYMVDEVPDINTANNLMEKVRSYITE